MGGGIVFFSAEEVRKESLASALDLLSKIETRVVMAKTLIAFMQGKEGFISPGEVSCKQELSRVDSEVLNMRDDLSRQDKSGSIDPLVRFEGWKNPILKTLGEIERAIQKK